MSDDEHEHEHHHDHDHDHEPEHEREFRGHTMPYKAPDDAGTGLITSAAIDYGDVICEVDTTFVTALGTERLQDTCSMCCLSSAFSVGHFEIDLKFCTRCRVVKYCGKACQKRHWDRTHKFECAIYQRLHPRVLPVNVRAAIRLIKLIRTNESDVQDDIALFGDLQSHIEDIRRVGGEQLERITLSARAVKEYTRTNLDIGVIEEYLAKIEVNGFSMTTPFGDVIGLCIQPPRPALRKIEPGEQILISYINNNNAYDIRQKELSERYFFTCKCPKCARGLNAPENRFIRSDLSPEDKTLLKNAEKEALELLAAARKVKTLDAIEMLKSAMKVLRDTKLWPITREPYVEIRTELINALIDAKKSWLALRHSAVRYLRIDPVLYPEPWNPMRNRNAFVLAKLVSGLCHKLRGREPSKIKYRMDAVSIVYPILSDLMKTVENELPHITMLYEEEFELLVAPVKEIGYDPSTESAAKAMRPEWETLEKITHETLELYG